jgi:hypothetical protein
MELMDVWMDGWMNRWMNEWLDGEMSVWMNEWMVSISVTIPAWARLDLTKS